MPTVLAKNNDPIGDALRADAVAYWKMDEASGNRLDATGGGKALAVGGSGTVGSSTGKVDNAAVLTVALDNRLTIINDESFQSLGVQAVSFWGWAKVDDFDPSSSDHTIIYADNEGNAFSTIDYIVAFNTFADVGSDKVRVEGYDANGDDYAYLESDNSITEGQWFFFAFSIDPALQKVTLRIDEVEVEQDFYASPVSPDPDRLQSLSIGCEGTFSSINDALFQVNGSVDEIGFLRRVLTTQEVAYLYNSGSGRSLYP